MTRVNDEGQPIGDDLGTWVTPPPPPNQPLTGRTVQLEPLDPARHTPGLFDAFARSPDSLWTYMAFGPFPTMDDLTDTLERLGELPDWQPYAITVDDQPVGLCSFLRIDPAGGVIEIGSIVFSAQLQRTTAATETIFLMIDHAFALGYRRVEWKCDDLNEPSRRAAHRFGFRYEATFRKATHYRGRNRDTAWFAIVDDDWPDIRAAFTRWLSPANFDADGRQRRPLQTSPRS